MLCYGALFLPGGNNVLSQRENEFTSRRKYLGPRRLFTVAISYLNCVAVFPFCQSALCIQVM